MHFIYDLHKTMIDNNLILIYEGEFTQEITKSVLSMAERNMDYTGEESSVKRKVFNVMVECLQNIVKHAENYRGNKDFSAIFMIGKDENNYVITTGNPIDQENIPKVKAKLDKINSLDRMGLKTLYKEIIKGTQISEKGGAGLGFVDMARKSGNELVYEFEEMTDTHSFFVLKSTINKN